MSCKSYAWVICIFTFSYKTAITHKYTLVLQILHVNRLVLFKVIKIKVLSEFLDFFIRERFAEKIRHTFNTFGQVLMKEKLFYVEHKLVYTVFIIHLQQQFVPT